MTYVMALDQGTSSSRAIIYNSQGEVEGTAQQTFDSIYPHDGWVEQDPDTLWQSILQVGRQAIAAASIEPAQVKAIGITNQRETTLLWDRQTGECLYNAIVWQDRRGADRCIAMAGEQLADGRDLASTINQITGLIIDPYFSSTKLAWLLSNVPQAQSKAEAGELCFGTVDSYLIWQLTTGVSHVTDATNASRTQLFDICANQWSPELTEYFAIPQSILPEVHDSVSQFGVADPQWFGAAIPILGVAGDQQAALIGQACFTPGMSKSTYGTGCFVMTHTGPTVRYSKKNLLATIAYRIDGQTSYALEGSIFVAGQAVKWLRDQLGLIEQAADTQAAYERTGGDAQGVYVVPSFTGLGAPHWRPDARGLITGMTLSTDKDHIITAFLQSVVFQTETLLRLMAEEGAPVDTLRVDGGMVVNHALCQFLSDILQVVVERPLDIETTAKGAGVLAAIGCGVLKDLPDAATHWRLDKRFESDMAGAIREKLLSGYEHALQQALT